MGLAQDLRYAARILFKHPASAAVALITLALGIGVNTALFSVVNAVLLRPLPYPEPERLVMIWQVDQHEGGNKVYLAPAGFADFRERSRAFESFEAISPTWSLSLTGQGEPERVNGAFVSSGTLAMLGLAPAIGRSFLPEEDQPGGGAAVILGDGLWQRRFGSDPGAIGRIITLDGSPCTVIGVLPREARLPGTEADLVLPLALNPFGLSSRTATFLRGVGRLREGVTQESAQAEIDSIARQMEQEHPDTSGGRGAKLVPLRDAVVGGVRPTLLILLAAVSLVLLIACANVANLLLARAVARRQEIAVRVALGAGRTRLIRQLLTESALLAILGGGAGFLAALWGVDALAALNPGGMPRMGEIGVDARVLLYTLLVALGSGFIAGLAPALHASRPDLGEALKQAPGRAAGTGQRLRAALVICQVAVALVLLCAAGLLLRSFWLLTEVDPGFRKDDLLALDLSLPESRFDSKPRRTAFYRDLLERLASLPGVLSVGAVNRLPLGGSNLMTGIAVEGRPEPPGAPPQVDRRVVSPDYFRTLGIALLRGRVFGNQDSADAPLVAIVNDAAARRFWPGEEPIGRRLRLVPGMQDWATIVGVAGDIRHHGLDSEPRPEVYVPYDQAPVLSMSIVIRAAGDPMNLAAAAREQVWALDRDQPVDTVRTMRQVLAASVAQPRFRALLVGLFAAVALVLAAVGVYGAMSWAVTRRTHEIGVRLALGARPADVLRMVVGQGAALALAGVGIGLASSWAVTRLMSGLLFGVSAADPATFAAAAAVLVLTALAACYVPARRAARVDPAIALRYE